MADSDDEYDRKRRDKFRGERAEATYRGTERVTRPRDDWAERDSWSRPRPREYRPGVRDRGYSPSMEPAAKRIRHDYYGDGFFNHYAPYHQGSHREPPAASQSEGQQPPMMSFKAFLATQDDNISDSEAIEKYNDYKLEFQRQQLNEFFVAHKDDECTVARLPDNFVNIIMCFVCGNVNILPFRLKYHPEDSVKRKEEQMASLKKRVAVFLEVLNGDKLSVPVDCSKTNDLLKLLDTVVIKLEGGTDEDLEVLSEEYAEFEKAKELKAKEEANNKCSNEVKNDDTSENEKKTVESETKENGQVENADGDDGALDDAEDGEIDQEKENVKADEVVQKDDKKETEQEEKEEKDEKESSEKEETETVEKENAQEKTDQEPEKKEKKRKRSYSGSSSGSGDLSGSESDDEKSKTEEKKEVEVEPEKPQEEPQEQIETIEDDKPEKPKSLHKTTSIFLRNLAPTITKQEVEAVCGRYEGFLRVALADPQPERRWLRRGWVTFKRDANIKEICWNLNNIRLRDCELGAIVNRDLSRRIRPVNGITAHKQVVRSDIRISARVVLHLDNKSGLWLEEDKKEKPQQTFGLVSNNPVLHNITDYLIEEASAEEEELLGLEPTAETQDSTSSVERDEVLISVLDRIILYLRIVHSVDYYNHCEYPNEDEMPNRCGILHARGPPPTTKTDMTQFIGAPVEAKMSSFLPEKPRDENKNEAKLISLSLKDVDTEIDKFVQANTRELAKDKWLCPLSGKKFKGPDFVRKHIFNKHAEKIEEVKKEVEFFNNYLKDPKRPMLAESPQPKREEPPTYSHPPYGGSYGGYGRMPYYNQGFSQRSRGYSPRTRGGSSDYRPVIHYRDLDAPREPEEFI